MKHYQYYLRSEFWTHFTGTLRTCYVILLVTFSVPSKTSQAEKIRYNVEPVELQNGYAISGGFIETNGAIGKLSAGDITNYEVSIAGAFPFVFSPDNTNASVRIRGNVSSSAYGISVGIDPSTLTADSPSLLLGADSGTIHYKVLWANWFTPPGAYIPEGSWIEYEAVDPTILQGFHAYSALRTTPQSQFYIATIPEPSSVFICLTAVLLGIGTGRRWRQ